MRMSELSAATGIAVPTLKFYLREGLLHAGERTSPNQARYDDGHVERVRLVRALLEVGGLPVARAVEVIAAMEQPDVSLSHAFGVAQRAVTEPSSVSSSATPDDAGAMGATGPTGAAIIAALCDRRSWHVHADNPGLAMAARVLDAYTALGQQELVEVLDAYAAAAELVASADLQSVADAGARSSGDRAAMVDVVIVGTVLGDALAAGLRRIAQEVESFRRFPDAAGQVHA